MFLQIPQDIIFIGDNMIQTLYDKFKGWSERGEIFITSDTHFYDSDRDFMGYNFSEADQIASLKKITKNDTWICLGDIGDTSVLETIWKPYKKPHAVLLTGNHDKKDANILKFFDEIYDGPLFISDRIILSHEPLVLGDSFLNIHGHDHSGIEPHGDHALNLAANVYGVEPFRLGAEIKNGLLAGIENYHRTTIDKATERKKEKANV